MGYIARITREVAALSPAGQAEVLEFILFLKAKYGGANDAPMPNTPAEITAFFRSFKVDTSAFKFDRDDAGSLCV